MQFGNRQKGIATLVVEWESTGNSLTIRHSTSGDKMPDRVAISIANSIIADRPIRVRLEEKR